MLLLLWESHRGSTTDLLRYDSSGMRQVYLRAVPGVQSRMTYDDAFRIHGISDTSTGSANWTYDYDPLDRLTSGVSASVTRGWTYDANGNRLTEAGTGACSYSNSPTTHQSTAIT